MDLKVRADGSSLRFLLCPRRGRTRSVSPHDCSADLRRFPSALRSWPSSLPPLISLCFTSAEKRSSLNHKPSGQLWLHHVPRSWPKTFCWTETLDWFSLKSLSHSWPKDRKTLCCPRWFVVCGCICLHGKVGWIWSSYLCSGAEQRKQWCPKHLRLEKVS